MARAKLPWLAAVSWVVVASAAADPLTEGGRRLRVSVVNADLAAVVARVAGREVDINVLFSGCILRPDLTVEANARAPLLAAEAVVWSGLFHESAAIYQTLRSVPPKQRGEVSRPVWIDVSHGAARVNVPTSSCEGFVEVQFMHGDPFFWLNPENGAVIAANVAAGLGQLRPERAEAWAANAKAFAAEMAGHLERWRQQLAPLAGVKVFVTQCGWANLTRLGGPVFMSCRGTPGALPSPAALAEQVKAQEVPLVVVDTHTPPEYAAAFRATTRAHVVTVPSTLAEVPGGRQYHQLFDHLLQRLLEAAQAAGVRAGKSGERDDG